MKIINLFNFLLVAALFARCSVITGPDNDDLSALLKYLHHVERISGFFYPDSDGLTGRVSGIGRRAEPEILNLLAELSLDLYYDPGGKQKDPDFWIGIPDKDPAFHMYCKAAGFELPDTLNQGGYVMEITQKGVILATQNTIGVVYGLQTLKQLWRQFPGKPELPCVKITDWPTIP